jgi:hypothetical protein
LLALAVSQAHFLMRIGFSVLGLFHNTPGDTFDHHLPKPETLHNKHHALVAARLVTGGVCVCVCVVFIGADCYSHDASSLR